MPFIRFTALAHYFKLVSLVLFLSKIMPSYSCCIEKGLIYIAIIALFSYSLSVTGRGQWLQSVCIQGVYKTLRDQS